MNWEIFGYIGTVLVLGSFLIEDIFKLRVVNTIGSAFWIIYGVGTSAQPTIIVNICMNLAKSLVSHFKYKMII